MSDSRTSHRHRAAADARASVSSRPSVGRSPDRPTDAGASRELLRQRDGRPAAPPNAAPGVLALQRSAGNRATVDLLRRSRPSRAPVSTRPAGTPSGTLLLQRSPGPGTALDQMQGLSNLLHNTVQWRAVPYLALAERVRPKYDTVLTDLAERFESAWYLQDYVLRDAEERAESENLVKGVLIGAAASVLVATGVGMVPALAKLATFSAGWWAVQAGGAVVSSAGGTAAAGAVASPTTFESSLPSSLMRTARLSGLLRFERELTRGLTGAFNIARLASKVDMVLDQLRDPARFGTTPADAEASAEELLRRRASIESAWPTVGAVSSALEAFEEKVDSFKIPSQKTFLEAIWVHWIKSLPLSDHDLLDNDSIEDHLFALGVLGSSGFLGVDTAKLFDTDEEKQAIRRARSRWPRMEEALAAP